MNKPHSAGCDSHINRAIHLIAWLIFSLSLAACSSVKNYVNNGPVAARTFSFLDIGSRPSTGYAEERKEAHAMVQHALIQNLAAKGVGHVPTGGDITVAYLIVVGNNVATTSLNSYFGYSDDSEALLQKAHAEQTNNPDNRSYFESGTLVIDFVDPHTSKLLQRRSIQAEVLRNLPMESRTTRVQAIVDQALKDVPITGPKTGS